MYSRFPNFKLSSGLNGTEVEMNGEELHGVIEATVRYRINEFPEVTLTFNANKVSLDAAVVNVQSVEPKKNENRTD